MRYPRSWFFLALALFLTGGCGKSELPMSEPAESLSRSVQGRGAVNKGNGGVLTASLFPNNHLPYPPGSSAIFQWNDPQKGKCRIEHQKNGRLTVRPVHYSGRMVLGPLSTNERLTVRCGKQLRFFNVRVNQSDGREMTIPPGGEYASRLFTYTHGNYVYKIGVSRLDGKGYYTSAGANQKPARWSDWTVLPYQNGYTDRDFHVLVSGSKIFLVGFSRPHQGWFYQECELGAGELRCVDWSPL